MPDGWPRGFKDYSADDPYCVRKFSERVRRVMEYFGRYPDELSFDRSLARVSLGNAIFTGGVLTVQSKGPRRRMVLVPEGSKAELPVSVWSAGQREFTPLLLGLSDVPEDRSQLGIGTVVIEEPGNGLAPASHCEFRGSCLGASRRGVSRGDIDAFASRLGPRMGDSRAQRLSQRRSSTRSTRTRRAARRLRRGSICAGGNGIIRDTA